MMDGPDTARVLFFVLLGSALLVGVFARYRGRLQAGAQHAAIWGLIFVGVVLAYGFKEQLSTNLFPSAVEQNSDGTIVLRRQADGHFYARAELNGTPVDFMVDTGATGIALSQNAAEAAGIDLQTLRYSGQVRTANGIARVAPVWIEDFDLAGRRDTQVRATVIESDLNISLLGMDYLDRFSRFTIEGDRLYLEP